MLRVCLLMLALMLLGCSKSDDRQLEILVAQRPAVSFQVGWGNPTNLSSEQRDSILEILSGPAMKVRQDSAPASVSFAHFNIGEKKFMLFGSRLEYVGSKDCFWWSDRRLSSMNDVFESQTRNIGNIRDISPSIVDKMLKCLER